MRWLMWANAAAMWAQEAPPAADAPVVFRSDVALVRIDVQVLDGNGPVTSLKREDFRLRDGAKWQTPRSMEREKLPMDIVLLLDVSGSMRPHIERVAHAAHSAVNVLGADDRAAVMVFDRMTRVRMPLKSARESLAAELDRLIDQERFNGGTDIPKGVIEAANYLRKNARKEARRAVVIVTDDRTERMVEFGSMEVALERADAVLSVLLAPDAMRQGQPGRTPGTIPGRGGPTNIPTVGGGLGDIIWGGRRGGGGPWGGPGGGGPGGGGGPVIVGGGGTKPAGTAEVAEQTGGDSFNVDNGSALEETFARLRQRYALYFPVAAGSKAGEERTIELALSDAAKRRYPGAQLKYRRAYTPDQDAPATSEEVTVVTAEETTAPAAEERTVRTTSEPAPRTLPKRRVAVDEPRGSGGGPAKSGGWRKTDEPDSPVVPPKPAASKP